MFEVLSNPRKKKPKFGFENLKVYQKTFDYIDFIQTLTEKFQKKGIYNLTQQFNRAADSVALNIGEGSAGTTKEFSNFIRISYRSLNECIVCSTLAHRRKYISDEENSESRVEVDELNRMPGGLRNSINKKK